MAERPDNTRGAKTATDCESVEGLGRVPSAGSAGRGVIPPEAAVLPHTVAQPPKRDRTVRLRAYPLGGLSDELTLADQWPVPAEWFQGLASDQADLLVMHVTGSDLIPDFVPGELVVVDRNWHVVSVAGFYLTGNRSFPVLRRCELVAGPKLGFVSTSTARSAKCPLTTFRSSAALSVSGFYRNSSPKAGHVWASCNEQKVFHQVADRKLHEILAGSCHERLEAMVRTEIADGRAYRWPQIIQSIGIQQSRA